MEIKKYIPSPYYMKLALESAEEGIQKGEGGPFGACIVTFEGKVISRSNNTVLLTNDPTAHAEVNAIRLASKYLNTFDLSHCIIYSTTEPCPMCFSAIHWARIPIIVYGTSIIDVLSRGFNEISLSNDMLNKYLKKPIHIIKNFMYEEAVHLLEKWDNLENKKIY